MAARAITKAQRLGGIDEKDTLLPFHPLAGRAIKPPKDASAAMTGEGQCAILEQGVKLRISNVCVPDHRVA